MHKAKCPFPYRWYSDEGCVSNKKTILKQNYNQYIEFTLTHPGEPKTNLATYRAAAAVLEGVNSNILYSGRHNSIRNLAIV